MYDFKEPCSPTEILMQVIFANSRILVDNKPVIWDAAMRMGILCVKDLINEEKGVLYDYAEFYDKYGSDISWLNYYSLLAAIPNDWKDKLSVHIVFDINYQSVCDRFIDLKKYIIYYL